MVNSEIAKHLKSHFKGQNLILTNEITKVILNSYPYAAPSTVAWRIFQLKKDKLLYQVGRGLYSFEYKPEFTPEVSPKTGRFYKRIKHLSSSEMCVWDTSILSTITDSEIKKNWIFIAVPKSELDYIYDQLLDFSKHVFLQPDNDVLQRYMLAQNDAIVLDALISETPVHYAEDYTSLSIEGLLVNALFENKNYLGALGLDPEILYSKAFEKYNVNRSKLLRYSSRRDKRKETEILIKKISKNGK